MNMSMQEGAIITLYYCFIASEKCDVVVRYYVMSTHRGVGGPVLLNTRIAVRFHAAGELRTIDFAVRGRVAAW